MKSSKLIIVLLFALISIFVFSFKRIPDEDSRPRNDDVKYLVVHYTANLDDGADAEANAKYLKRMKNVGCHYAIDDKEIIQCVSEDSVAYAIGDRRWSGFIPKSWYKNKINNDNSISYEMCLGGGRDDSKIIDQTAHLIAAELIDRKFYIEIVDNGPIIPDLSRIVRHHDVSGKHCPRFNYNDSRWNSLKEEQSFSDFKKIVESHFYEILDERYNTDEDLIIF